MAGILISIEYSFIIHMVSLAHVGLSTCNCYGDGLRLSPVAGVEVEAHAGHNAARSTLALVGVSPRHPHSLQALHPTLGVEPDSTGQGQSLML